MSKRVRKAKALTIYVPETQMLLLRSICASKGERPTKFVLTRLLKLLEKLSGEQK